MVDYTCSLCQKCDRFPSTCDFPCETYSKALDALNLEENAKNFKNALKIINPACTETHNPPVARLCEVGISHQTAVSCDVDYISKGGLKLNKNNELDEFMYNFIESSVDQPEFLQVCNSLVHPNKIVDWEVLLDYMREKNYKYCDDNLLCETCHHPLKKYDQVEECWGSKMVVGAYWGCPNNC